MPLRNWNDVPYLPILSLRPAEMRALEELPGQTKERLLPLIHLRPWVGAHQLDAATARISEAYGDRSVVIAVGDREDSNGRPVHSQLDALRNSEQGFQRWVNFVQARSNYIPAIQFSAEVQQEQLQIERLYALDRGLVVVIDQLIFDGASVIARRVADRTQGGRDVCFVIDYGQARREHLDEHQSATAIINTIRQFAPNAAISISASSFPDSFVGRTEQQIFEREMFNRLAGENLIYSDRGSARVERQIGGGGQPAPRIDYPLSNLWKFYRSDTLIDFVGYQQQALRLMADAQVWNPNLRVWGTQMIERTAAGDTSAIGSAVKATAARINLHLQRQTFYSAPELAEDTDEEWSG